LSRMFTEVLVATSAAQIMTLPVLWAHFGEISPLALLANALVLPVQPLILLPGVLIALLGVPLPALARALGYLLWLPLHWSISVAQWISTIPWATVALPRMSPVGAWLCYALLAFVTLLLPIGGRRSSRVSSANSRSLALMAGSVCVVGLLWAAVFTLPDGRLHVYALDVGQGDALLLRTPQGHVILVDGGPDPVLLATRIGEALPFWERDIDLLLVTHDDSDHIGGLAPLLQRYRVARVLRAGEPASGEVSLALQDSLAAAGLSPQRVGRGTEITLGECMLSVLHPGPRVVHNAPADNDASMVIRVQQGRFAMLLTGDIGETTEGTLLASDLPLEAIALKVSHHGSPSSSTMSFLEAVTPQLAVISVGQDNRYGHPDAAVIQRLHDAGALVLRTDQQGTIEIATDGERVWVRTAR
jgi:competence protein ComEC